MSIHQGHRARVKKRFLEEGLDGFNEHQVLELLLFYAIPQKDTNEIAHNLLNRFGSLPRVFEAPVKELSKVAGMGDNASAFISLIRQLARYYYVNQSQKVSIMNSLEQCGEYLVPFFDGLTRETVYLLCLDAKRKVISCRAIDEGSVNCTAISIRKIVDTALTENATSVVLAHNHIGGFAAPSEEDVYATHQIEKALQFVDVVLLDHVVVSDGDYISMVNSDSFRPTALSGTNQENGL